MPLTDSINTPVDQPSTTRIDDLLDRIALCKVDGRATDLLCLCKTLRHAVNHVHVRRAQKLGRVRRHQAHGARTKHSNRFSSFEAGNYNTMIASREDICEQSKVFLMLCARWEDERVEIGVRNADVLGLASGVRAHSHVTVRAACESGVDRRAEGRLASLAVEAATASNVERHDHPVTLLDHRYGWSDFLDDAHVLVTEDDAGLGCRTAFVHVQIATANA